MRWLKTEGFAFACVASNVNAERTLDTFKELGRYDFPLRTKLFQETVFSTIGGASNEKASGD